MKQLLLATCTLLVCNVFAQKIKHIDTRLVGLDTALTRVLATSKAPSFAVAVVEKNKVVFAKAFGYRDLENKIPADTNTLYAIGSCTKAFTSSLIGMLEKDGKVDFDKPVRNYFPELKFYNDEMNNHITLRDMMSHRTGLPRHDISWYLFPSSDRDSLLQRIQYQEPNYGLREKWQYNNFMFFAQGKLVEKLTGKSWEDNMRERFFLPLNMKSSNMPYTAVKNEADLAVPYGLKKDSSYQKLSHYNVGTMGPAGSVYSNVMDMANWISTWINGGKFNGKEILTPAYIKQATGSQTIIEPGGPDNEKPDIMFATYGFGWFMSSYKGHYRVEHGGNIDGFSANVSYFPTDSIGIVVLCNQNGAWVPAAARNIIADYMLKLPHFNWVDDIVKSVNKGKKTAEEAKKSAISNQKKNTKPSHELKDYEGLFSNPGYGTMEVVLKNDSLFANTPGKKIWLEHYHYDVFVPFLLQEGEKIDTGERPDMRIVYITDAAGDINSLQLNGAEDPKINLVFKRSQKPKSVSKEELNQYTGTYSLGDMNMKFYVKGESLYASVPGQPDYELAAIQDKDKFSFKSLNGYFVQFNRNDKNEIDAVSFIQPNGTFKATKKTEK